MTAWWPRARRYRATHPARLAQHVLLLHRREQAGVARRVGNEAAVIGQPALDWLAQIVRSPDRVLVGHNLLFEATYLIAAGIRISTLEAATRSGQAVVRCMPNTPALVQAGATGLYANKQVSAAQKQLGGSIMDAVGLSCWLENEDQLDAVTALSGSGQPRIRKCSPPDGIQHRRCDRPSARTP